MNNIVNQKELLGAIDKILLKSSTAKRVSDTQKMNGPVGIITGATYDRVNDKLKTLTEEVQASTKKIRTEFTLETLQDMATTYGENFYDVLAHYLINEITYQIDEDFLTKIKGRASTKKTLTFSGADFNNALYSVGQSIAITVNKGLCDLPISDNRSPQGWAVVSSNVASLLGGVLGDTAKGSLDDDSPSYLGRIAGVDYYIDYTHPNDGEDSIVFGIKGNGVSKGSTIYSPYTTEWIDMQNPEDGEKIFFLLVRSALTINPLDKEYLDKGEDSAFLGKINVDLTDLEVFK